jgi:hypothetical protein
MSNNIRIYSDDDKPTAVELRRVRYDDAETNSWRKLRAEEGTIVLDILGYGGRRETTLDVADLFRLMKREFPDQFAELVTAPALTSKETCFAELLTLEKTMSESIETARSGKTEHDDPWAEAYDSVFCAAVSKRIWAIFDEMGVFFEYYDPDMDYDDDVLAFYNAVKDKLEELKPDYPYVVGLQR